MKKKYNLLVLEALKFFIENPNQKIHLREFSRKLKISVNSAQRFLDLFLKQEFITEERKVNLRYFQANLNNIVFRSIKITFSLQKIKDSRIVDYLKEAEHTFIVLFGSTARGNDDPKSDIDLVCIGGKNVALGDFEKKMNKEINVHFFSWLEWKKQSKKNKGFYQDVISQGITLLGNMPIVD